MNNIEINNVTYIKLHITCPHCQKNGKYPPRTEWIHKDCGGLIYIGDNAQLLCNKCGWNILLSRARYNCPIHHNCVVSFIEENPTSVHFDELGEIFGQIGHIAGRPFLSRLVNYYKRYYG